MAVTQETIRKITVQAQAQGVDAAATSLKNMAAAQANVAKESEVLSGAQIRSAAAAERLRAAQEALAKAGSNSAVAQEKVLLAQQRAIKADEALAASAERLRKAQFDLNAVKNYGASVTDISTRKVLSAEDAHKRQAAAINSAAVATQGFSKAVSLATNALGAMGLALGVGAMVAYGKSVFNTTADLQEQADQVLGAGGNVEAFQALHAVFLTNGISAEQGDKLVAKLTRTLGEAAEGSKKAQDAFKALHLGSEQLAGKDGATGMSIVATKLLEIKDNTLRAAAEAGIFGEKLGQKLEPALRSLKDPMETLIQRAKDLGVVIDKDMIEKADMAKDAMALSFMKLKVAIAPIVVEWGEGFAKLVGNIDKVTKSLGELWDKAKLFASIGVGARVGFAVGGLPGAAAGAAVGAVGYAASRDDQYQKAVANYDAQLAGGGLSPSERTDIQARRTRALAQANTQVGYSGLVTLDKMNGYVAPAAANNNATPWAPTKEDLANAKKIEDSRHHVKLDEESIKKTAEELAKIGVEDLKRKAQEEQHVANVKLNTELYMQDLEREVDLAGMSTDAREQQAAIMEGMRASEKQLTDAQVQHIKSTVAARQEAERWRGVVDDISNGFQGFFEDVLENGKLSFSSLWDSIKKTFIQMLAYMATQALINPIIVPVVGGLRGAVGSLSSGVGSIFSGAGSITDLFSGGILNGGTLPNWLGTGEAFGGGDFIGTASDSIFGGGGLSGVLSGFGIGSLLGGVMGGNSLVSGGLGAIGGVLGGPIGMVAGGLIGGALGNFGASNQGAISNFTSDGLGNTLFKAGGGNNGQLATAATTQINQSIKALRDAGLNVSLGNISGLSVGSDKSYVYDFAGGKQKLAGGEAGVSATANAIFDRILPSVSGGNEDAAALLAKYGSLNSGNLAGFLGELQAQQAQKAADAQAAAAKSAADAAAEIKALSDAMDVLADTVAKAQDQLVKSYNAESTAIQATINRYRDQAASLRQYRDQLGGAGANPGAAYGIAKGAFTAYAGLAGTDGFDAGRYQQLGDNFLSASRANSSTLAQYRRDRGLVYSTTSGAANMADSIASDASRQLEALNASVAGLININTSVMSVKDAVKALQDALAAQSKATAENTDKIATLLTRVTRDGNALVTEAA